MVLGPSIELFPETYNDSTMKKNKKIITEEDEMMLDLNLCVNLEPTKVSVIKGNDASARHVFQVSLGANAKPFFQLVCQKLRVPFSQSKFSYFDEEYDSQPINLGNFSETLSELGIKENMVISVTTSAPVSNRVNNPIFAYDDELSRQSKETAVLMKFNE